MEMLFPAGGGKDDEKRDPKVIQEES